VAHGENEPDAPDVDRLVLEHVRALTVVAEWTRPTGEHPLPRGTHSWAENAAGTEEERYRYTLLRPGPRVTSHEDMSARGTRRRESRETETGGGGSSCLTHRHQRGKRCVRRLGGRTVERKTDFFFFK